MVSVEEAKQLFPKKLEDMLTFEEEGKYVVIKPRQYLGSDNFAKIASMVRIAGGDYISAGKESHFRLERSSEPKAQSTFKGRLIMIREELDKLIEEVK